MPTDDKLVHDVLEYLNELGDRMPGLAGLWSHPAAVASYIDSSMDIARVRRLLDKMMRADLVRDCDEPVANRSGRRGAPRRLFQITGPGRNALRLLEKGERISFAPVYRAERSPSLRHYPEKLAPLPPVGVPEGNLKVANPLTRPVPAAPPKAPPGVNPFQVLYDAVEDYLEVAEPEQSPEYQALVRATAVVRQHRSNSTS